MEPRKQLPPMTDFIPMQFPVDVDIGTAVGAEGRNQIAINDRPFVLQYLTHQIVPGALSQDADVTGWAYQDGLYSIDWSLYEQSRFWKGVPPLADAAFGSIRTGKWIKFPAGVSCIGNETLHVTVRNAVLRQTVWRVHIIFHGVQHLGSITQAHPRG